MFFMHVLEYVVYYTIHGWIMFTGVGDWRLPEAALPQPAQLRNARQDRLAEDAAPPDLDVEQDGEFVQPRLELGEFLM